MMLGQKRMASLGHPAASSASVLEAVLRLTGSSVTREDELCTGSCQVRRGAFHSLKNRYILTISKLKGPLFHLLKYCVTGYF